MTLSGRNSSRSAEGKRGRGDAVRTERGVSPKRPSAAGTSPAWPHRGASRTCSAPAAPAAGQVAGPSATPSRGTETSAAL